MSGSQCWSCGRRAGAPTDAGCVSCIEPRGTIGQRPIAPEATRAIAVGGNAPRGRQTHRGNPGPRPNGGPKAVHQRRMMPAWCRFEPPLQDVSRSGRSEGRGHRWPTSRATSTTSSSAMPMATTGSGSAACVDRASSRRSSSVSGSSAEIWIDDDKLRGRAISPPRFRTACQSSAVFLLLPSPTYIRSDVLRGRGVPDVRRDDRGQAREVRFGQGFANELFALRCPILPVDNNEHWSLFPGADRHRLLRRRGHVRSSAARSSKRASAPGRRAGRSAEADAEPQHVGVPLSARIPRRTCQDAHALVGELAAHSYRVLPDRQGEAGRPAARGVAGRVPDRRGVRRDRAASWSRWPRR